MEIRKIFDEQQGPLKVDLVLALNKDSMQVFLTTLEQKADAELVSVAQAMAYNTMPAVDSSANLNRLVAVKQFIKEFRDLSQIEI